MEGWGKAEGYTGGGNFDANPDLKVYIIKKYAEMKERGQLSSLGVLEDQASRENYQSQLLQEPSAIELAEESTLQLHQSEIGGPRKGGKGNLRAQLGEKQRQNANRSQLVHLAVNRGIANNQQS